MALAGAAVVALTSCSSMVSGVGVANPDQVPPAGKPLGYQPSDLTIQFADSSSDARDPDQIARDALADVNAYYASFYPEVFGTEFTPPAGGYYSIGPGEGNASACMDGPDDPFVENNAFYCSLHDEIVYWRPLLARYAEDYSDMQVGLVLAHEMGHLIQDRQGTFDVPSIVAETQADCFAGTWARAVADGKAPHFKFNPENLDATLLVWSTELPSPVGSDPNDQSQHGSAFDRVTAFQEGYEEGPTACRDQFTVDRIFTSMEFTADNSSADGQGNDTYDNTLVSSQRLYEQFYATRVPELNGTWSAPSLLVNGSGAAGCPTDHTITVCPSNNSVVISNDDALRDVHANYGDYAVFTALGLAYGIVAITELGYSPSDPLALQAASCLTGAVSGELLKPDNPYNIILSPGDFDEATLMLLDAGPENPIVDTGSVSAFDRLDSFRTGVVGGAGACGVQG